MYGKNTKTTEKRRKKTQEPKKKTQPTWGFLKDKKMEPEKWNQDICSIHHKNISIVIAEQTLPNIIKIFSKELYYFFMHDRLIPSPNRAR